MHGMELSKVRLTLRDITELMERLSIAEGEEIIELICTHDPKDSIRIFVKRLGDVREQA